MKRKRHLALCFWATLVFVFYAISSCGDDSEDPATADESEETESSDDEPPEADEAEGESDQFDCFDAVFALLDVVGNAVDAQFIGGTCPTITRTGSEEGELVTLLWSNQCDWSGGLTLSLVPTTENQGELDVAFTGFEMDGADVGGSMSGTYLVGAEKVTLELDVDQTFSGNLQCTVSGPVTIVVDKRDPPPPPPEPNRVAWITLTAAVIAAIGSLLLLYGIVLWRLYCPMWAATKHRPRVGYRAALDLLSQLGLRRRYGETREQFAVRVKGRFPAFEKITNMHLAARFGWPTTDLENRREFSAAEWNSALESLKREIAQTTSKMTRYFERINPISFLGSR